MRALRIASSVLAGAVAVALPAFAQDAFDPAPPAHVAFVDGGATLDREDVTEAAMPGTPLVDGDRVRTDRGRVEILFPDGSALDVDEYSAVELQAPGLLRVTSGRVLLTVFGASDPASAARFQLDTPAASAQTNRPGEYRLSLLSGPSGIQTDLSVVRGSATLVTDRGSMPLRAGERSVAWENAAPSYPQSFNSARFDAFDQWAALRRDERGGSRSAQYLPSDLRMYGGALDRYGAWEYDAPYGYVWYPRVAPDWRPYYDGYWSSVPRYGWTWIGLDVWSWPTHHYGRWGFGGARWFWIPDRRFAPAWVSWGGAPGYVSWCPLGFNNRPVFALSISNHNTWAGWTVLPRERFGGRGWNVHQFAVAPRTIPAHTPFIVQTTAPAAPGRAVPRRIVGGSSGSSGNSRSSSPIVGRPPTSVPGRAASDENRTPQAVSRQPGIGGTRSGRGARPSTAPPSGVVPPAATAPAAPGAPERPRSGAAISRRPPDVPFVRPPAAPSAAPDPRPIAPPAPRGRAAAPRNERPTAPPDTAAPPPAARETAPAPPPPAVDRQQARPRSGNTQSSSPASPPAERPSSGRGSRRPS